MDAHIPKFIDLSTKTLVMSLILLIEDEGSISQKLQPHYFILYLELNESHMYTFQTQPLK